MGHQTTESDEVLMRAVQRGDSAAFDRLASRCRSAVAARLHDIIRDPGAADDLVQETLLRAWTRADQWDGRGPARAWMVRIATNLALNHLRTVRRRRESPLDAAEPAGQCDPARLKAVSPGADGQVMAAESTRRMRGLVGALPGEKRDVLTLACDEDLSVREIAERLDIPEGTVKSRLHHARKWLSSQWMLRENEGKDLR